MVSVFSFLDVLPPLGGRPRFLGGESDACLIELVDWAGVGELSAGLHVPNILSRQFRQLTCQKKE